MRAVKYEFPNPVLIEGMDDYKDDCEFSGTIDEDKIVIDNKNILIPVSYTLKCRGLENIVKNGLANVVVSAISGATSLSILKKFDDGKTEMVVKIPKFSVAKKIELSCSVVAAQDISNFSCAGELNELYFGGVEFEIRKGDILAAAESKNIYIDQDELEKKVTSVFSICCANDDNDQKYDTIPRFDGEKITIMLKRELYDLYYRFKDINSGQLRRYVTSVIVYPALVEAVGYIIGYHQQSMGTQIGSNGGDDYSEKRWFRNISAKIDELGLDSRSPEESPTTIADALLKGISLDALRDLNTTLGAEANSGVSEDLGGRD